MKKRKKLTTGGEEGCLIRFTRRLEKLRKNNKRLRRCKRYFSTRGTKWENWYSVPVFLKSQLGEDCWKSGTIHIGWLIQPVQRQWQWERLSKYDAEATTKATRSKYLQTARLWHTGYDAQGKLIEGFPSWCVVEYITRTHRILIDRQGEIKILHVGIEALTGVHNLANVARRTGQNFRGLPEEAF